MKKLEVIVDSLNYKGKSIKKGKTFLCNEKEAEILVKAKSVKYAEPEVKKEEKKEK